MEHTIGIDIGGTKISVSLAEIDGEAITFLDKKEFPTRVELGVEQAIEQIYSAIDSFMAPHRLEGAPLLMGISCGGPLDTAKGLILSPPNLLGWNEIPIVAMLNARYHCPVYLQNDANACGVAEWLYGAGKGYQNVVFLTFGTGLGAGLILNGRLYEGAGGMSGEVGHIRLQPMGPVGFGKMGSFEGFCSGGGIAQLARSVVLERLQMGRPVAFCPDTSSLQQLDARTVFASARAGDECALDIVSICADHLGRGLSVIIDLLNPEAIVLGTIFAQNHDLLRPAMERSIQREALPKNAALCNILPAKLQPLGDYAAISTAVYGQRLQGL